MEITGFMSAMAPSIAAINTEHLIQGCGAMCLSELGLLLVKFSLTTSPHWFFLWFSHLITIHLILSFLKFVTLNNLGSKTIG